MSINKLAKEIHENNKAKGFYEGEKNIGEMLALIHSEVSEALECDRKGRHIVNNPATEIVMLDALFGDDITTGDWKEKFEENVKDTFEDELADIMIRVMDLAAYKGVDLDAHIKAKIQYNTLRPYKHGKKY